nr:RNA-dependent RNA polymerase [Flumine sobemo-like virus 24]
MVLGTILIGLILCGFIAVFGFLYRKALKPIVWHMTVFLNRCFYVKKVQTPPQTYLEGTMVYGNSRFYLSVEYEGKELRCNLPIGVGMSMLPTVTTVPDKTPEMAVKGSFTAPCEKDFKDGIVSFRDSTGKIIGMGSRIKSNNRTYLLTAAHVYNAIRNNPSIVIEHKSLTHKCSFTGLAAYSKTGHYDFAKVTVPDIIWSSLGVKALRTKFAGQRAAIMLWGYDEGGNFITTTGQLNPKDTMGHVFHTASTFAGWSGTPLLDQTGSVVGLHCGAHRSEGMNYGITKIWDSPRLEENIPESNVGYKSSWNRLYDPADFQPDSPLSKIHTYEITFDVGEPSSPKYQKLTRGTLNRFYYDKVEDVGIEGPSWADDFGDLDYSELPVFPEGNLTPLPEKVSPPKPLPALPIPSMDQPITRSELAEVLKVMESRSPSPVEDPHAKSRAELSALREAINEERKNLDLFKEQLVSSAARSPRSASPRGPKTRERAADFPKGRPQPRSPSSSQRAATTGKKRKANPSKVGKIPPSSKSVEAKLEALATQMSGLVATFNASKTPEPTLPKQQSGSSPEGHTPQSVGHSEPILPYSSTLQRLMGWLSPRQLSAYYRFIQRPEYQELADSSTASARRVLAISLLSSIIYVGIGSNRTRILASLSDLSAERSRRSMQIIDEQSLLLFMKELGSYLQFPSETLERPRRRRTGVSSGTA